MSSFIRLGEYDKEIGITVDVVYSEGPKISIQLVNNCYETSYQQLTIDQTYDLISILQEKINDITSSDMYRM